MSPEPQDGEAIETPEADPISKETLLVLLDAMARKMTHLAGHTTRGEYHVTMLELQDAAAGVTLMYRLAQALLAADAAAN